LPVTNVGSATPLGCTVDGTGGAATSTAGNANASRSPATDDSMRDSTAPPTPAAAPATRKPNVTSDTRRPGSGASGESSRSDNSRRNTATPQAVPISVGTVSAADAPARDSTAPQPTTPASTIAADPTGTRGVSHSAVIAAITAMMPNTSTDSTSLSAKPKVWIAHSLTGPGVRSMTADPTAVRASASGPNATARSCVTPTATAAAAMPAIALAPRAVMTQSYRSGHPKGLPNDDVS
jgi:hypothetical protein